jgi:hypothetical protein
MGAEAEPLGVAPGDQLPVERSRRRRDHQRARDDGDVPRPAERRIAMVDNGACGRGSQRRHSTYHHLECDLDGNAGATFRLANSWTYSTGNYTQTVLFTLSAP